jgi:hypothetical protein
MKPRFARRLLFLGAALAAGLAALPALADGDGWILARREASPERGYALYRRQAPGDAFATWRLETELEASPALVERVTLRNLVDARDHAPGRSQRVLRREGNAYWVHAEISVALAADRDAVLRIERRRDPATGGLRIEWRADPDAGPPPKPGVVRLRVSRGYWLFTPADGGRTHAVYESYAEPGGPFPSWLVDTISSGEVMDALARLRSTLATDAELPAVSAEGAFGG